MKKILALVLAAAMMSTMAFAVNNIANPGDDILFNDEHFKDEDTHMKTPVEDLHAYDFTDDNFTLVAKYKKGSELVEKAYIDNDATEGEEVVVTLKKNNLLERKEDKAANLVFDELYVKARRTMKDDDDKKVVKAGTKYEYDFANKNDSKEWFVGYDPDAHFIEMDNEDYDLDDSDFGYTKTSDEGKEVKAEVTYNFGDARFVTKVFADDAYYFEVDSKYDDVMDVVKANEDVDFDVYNVTADGLGTVKVWFDDVEEGEAHIYKYDGKKLSKANVKFDEEELCYYTTVRGDATIIVAEEDLNGVTAGNASTNPETGR